MGDVGLNFFEQMKTTPVFTPSRLLAKSLRNFKKKKKKKSDGDKCPTISDQNF